MSNLMLQGSSCTLHTVTILLAVSLSAHAFVMEGRVKRLREPHPREAARAILDAFDNYPLVALGEAHRNQQVHDLILSLVHDPGFPEKVNDIVVEFGSAR